MDNLPVGKITETLGLLALITASGVRHLGDWSSEPQITLRSLQNTFSTLTATQ